MEELSGRMQEIGEAVYGAQAAAQGAAPGGEGAAPGGDADGSTVEGEFREV